MAWREAPAWLGVCPSQVMQSDVGCLASAQPLFGPGLRAPNEGLCVSRSHDSLLMVHY